MNTIDIKYKMELKITTRNDNFFQSFNRANLMFLLRGFGEFVEDKESLKYKFNIDGLKLIYLIKSLLKYRNYISKLEGYLTEDLKYFNSLTYVINDLGDLIYLTNYINKFTLIKYKLDKNYIGLVSKKKTKIAVYKTNNGYFLPVDYIDRGILFYKGYPYSIRKGDVSLAGYLQDEVVTDNSFNNGDYLSKDKLLKDGFLSAYYTVNNDIFTYLFIEDITNEKYNKRLLDTLIPDDSVEYFSIGKRDFRNVGMGYGIVYEFKIKGGRKYILMFNESYIKYDAYIKNKLNFTISGRLINKKEL